MSDEEEMMSGLDDDHLHGMDEEEGIPEPDQAGR